MSPPSGRNRREVRLNAEDRIRQPPAEVREIDETDGNTV